ncbi:hypothetical protein WA158_004854 [Blastocystis sp. Blastoise]
MLSEIDRPENAVSTFSMRGPVRIPRYEITEIVDNETVPDKSLRSYTFPDHPRYQIPIQIIQQFKRYEEFLLNNETFFVNRTISFKPTTHGLGNKLHGLHSALFFAMVTHRRLCICDWPEFSQLFYFTFNVPLLNSSDYRCQSRIVESYVKPQNDLLFQRPVREFLGDGTILFTSNMDCLRILQYNNYYRRLMKSFGFGRGFLPISDFSVIFKHYIYHKVMLPQPVIRRKIELEYNSWMNCVYIGIHIRTGDYLVGLGTLNLLYSRNTSVLLMIQHAMNLTKISPFPVKWFLCTDNSVLKLDLLQSYPHHIITYSSTIAHTGSNNNTLSTGISDAIIEMYLLGKCNYLITSLYSTFSENAYSIAGIVPQVIR